MTLVTTTIIVNWTNGIAVIRLILFNYKSLLGLRQNIVNGRCYDDLF